MLSNVINAFIVPWGHYEFKRLPFGLQGAPATFQRLMDSVLQGLDRTRVCCYLDDVLVISNTFEDHLATLKAVFERFRRADLHLKPSKCQFLLSECVFLGYVLSKDGLRVDSSKIEDILRMARPKDKSAVRRFLGLTGYWRRFIKGYASIARPLQYIVYAVQLRSSRGLRPVRSRSTPCARVCAMRLCYSTPTTLSHSSLRQTLALKALRLF